MDFEKLWKSKFLPVALIFVAIIAVVIIVANKHPSDTSQLSGEKGSTEVNKNYVPSDDEGTTSTTGASTGTVSTTGTSASVETTGSADPAAPSPSSTAKTPPSPESPSKAKAPSGPRKSEFLQAVEDHASSLYNRRSDSVSGIRDRFDALFTPADEKTLRGNKAYFTNYYRFCFVALPLHADGFNAWFADETISESDKEQFLEGMKAAVLSEDFRNQANAVIIKVNPAWKFSMVGDVMIQPEIDDVLKKSSAGA